MSSLFDAEKLRRLLVLAGTKVRPKGKSMVGVVVGVWMNVYVNNSGYVEIRAGRGSLEVYVNKMKSRDAQAGCKVCDVLRRMHEETMNEGNKKRVKETVKTITSIGCETLT